MSSPLDSAYISHIREAIGWIESYLTGVDEAEFRTRKLIQDGVIRQLEIIGEAVKRLSAELRAAHPDTPWSQIAKIRDKLIHDYLGVDLQVVWDTTRRDVPRLKAAIDRIEGKTSS
jgi:uncharacterized protein with HEPN domain